MRRKLLTVSNQLLTLEKFSDFSIILFPSVATIQSQQQKILHALLQNRLYGTQKNEYFAPDPISIINFLYQMYYFL